MDIKELCEKLDQFKSRLSKTAVDMDDIGARADAIARQLKRNRPVRDDSFEADFNKNLDELKKLLAEFEAYVKSLSELTRSGAKQLRPDDSAQVKNLAFHARNVSLEADKFSSSFRNAHREGKNLQIKLNWWMVEAYRNDLEHLVGKLLFAARELSKLAESRTAQAPAENTPPPAA